MNILILGGGGREHALAWAFAQNPKCDRLWCAPGNAGIAAEVHDLKQGREALEERARYELGLVRPDEVFFQINPAPEAPPR